MGFYHKCASSVCEQREPANRTWQGWVPLALLLPITWVLLTGVQCVPRRPIEPGPVKYNVYFGSSGYNNIYVVDLDSLLLPENPPIKDSIPGLNQITDLAASADGVHLYVQSNLKMPPWNPALKKIDTGTGDTLGIIPNSEGARLVKLADPVLLRSKGSLSVVSGCMREIIDTDRMTVIRVLPDTVCGFKGSESGLRIAAAVGGTSRLCGLDVQSGEYWGEYIARIPGGGQTLHVVDAFLHPNDSLVGAIATTAGQIEVWFLLGNLYTGETELSQRIVRATGSVGITSDGVWCVFTEAGHSLVGGPWVAYTVDVRARAVVNTFNPTNGLELPPTWCTILPGDRYVLVTPDDNEAGVLGIINLKESQAARTIYMSFSNFPLGGIAVGMAH